MNDTRARATASRPWCRAFGALALLTLAPGCSKDRATDDEPPTYREEIGPLMHARCAPCHDGATPAGGFAVSSYLGAIGCASGGESAVTVPAAGAPAMLRALDDETHRGVVDAAARDSIARWITAGAPAFRDGVHAPGFVDPRSPAFHGASLRRARWAPMLDAAHDQACGRCHDGAPSRPAKITSAAPGATACTTCHTEPAGVLACSTCHGVGARPYPPRDPCFFPADTARAGAHRAHVEPGDTKPAYPCSTCHPVPGEPVLSASHANGTIDVVFDPAIAGPNGSWDAAAGTCAVGCHLRGGARERPAWGDASGPLACNGCHASPPPAHFPGACTTCHAEANATGTALAKGPLHLNGRVDLGDGSQTCTACHGGQGEPWPSTGSHAPHRSPTLTTPIDCASCHVVPSKVLDPSHLSGKAEVTFAGRALDRGAAPTWTGSTCAEVACHGAKLALPPGPSFAPTWGDTSGAARACTACHGAPPLEHTPSTSCDRSDCHGAEIGRSGSDLWITPSGRALHVNGAVDLAK